MTPTHRILEKQQPRLCYVHLAALAILTVILTGIYLNSFQVPFVFDDLENVVEKTSMQMTSISYNSLYRATFEGVNSRRWVPNLSYALNYYFGGHDVWGYHLFNLLVHIMTSLVLYGLFFTTLTLPRLGFSQRRAAEIALIAAVVWAAHPLQTNAVTYIVQRMTSMAALFYLASLLFYVRGRLQKRLSLRCGAFWVASLVCGLLALASKENSAMLLPIILAYEFYFLRDTEKQLVSMKGLALVAISLLGTLAIGWMYLGKISLLSFVGGYGGRDFTLLERLLTETRIVLHYLTLLVLPLPSRLNLDYDYGISSSILSPPITLLAILVIICLVGLIFALYRRHRLLSFGLLWFMANLVIESTVIPLELIFEHRLYLPSPMLILAFVVAIYGLRNFRQKTLRLSWAAVIIVLCLFTWQRNVVWSSEINLWRDVVTKSPELPRAYSYLGRAYNIEERYQESFDFFQQAPPGNVYDANFYNNWGKAAFQLGKTKQAVELLERAVRLDYNHPEGHYNLGVAYGSLGRVPEARREMILGMGLQQLSQR